MHLKTEELDKKLMDTKLSGVKDFVEKNQAEMISSTNACGDYIKTVLSENKISQRDAFIMADIPERYGYKILSGEKRTRKRDVILRICYAAQLNIEQTNRALKMYGMSELYSRIPRDAMIMVCFNERPGSIVDVNAFLANNNLEPLEITGEQE